MTGGGGDAWLAGALATALYDRVAVEVGAPEGPGWTSLAHAGAGPAFLTELAGAMARASGDADPEAAVRSAFAWVTWVTAGGPTRLAHQAGRLVMIEPSRMWLHAGLVGGHPAIDRIAFAAPEVTVLAGDELAGGARVRVAGSREELYRLHAEQLARALGPVLEQAFTRVTGSRRSLWSVITGDTAGSCFHLATDADDPHSGRREAEAFIAAAAETPLAMRLRFVEFTHGGRAHVSMRTPACCLAYRTPHVGEDGPHPSSAGPWQHYCSTCPVVPEEETVRRAVWWLEHADGTS